MAHAELDARDAHWVYRSDGALPPPQPPRVEPAASIPSAPRAAAAGAPAASFPTRVPSSPVRAPRAERSASSSSWIGTGVGGVGVMMAAGVGVMMAPLALTVMAMIAPVFWMVGSRPRR